jgi:hypothetical protein
MKQPKLKWRFAIGTSSVVPGEPSMHHLIGDVDGKDISTTLIHLLDELEVIDVVVQATTRGFHFYNDRRFPFRDLVRVLRRVPGVDAAWIRIGQGRGYFFLADKPGGVSLPWPVTRMVIHANEAK